MEEKKKANGAGPSSGNRRSTWLIAWSKIVGDDANGSGNMRKWEKQKYLQIFREILKLDKNSFLGLYCCPK
jgi:hypothetical protein